jgi:hypothetical protein
MSGVYSDEIIANDDPKDIASHAVGNAVAGRMYK